MDSSKDLQDAGVSVSVFLSVCWPVHVWLYVYIFACLCVCMYSVLGLNCGGIYGAINT